MLFLVAVLISSGLTFWLFAPRTAETDPLRTDYAQVFDQFGANAEEIYQQYEDAYGLEILRQHGTEGLRIVKQYGRLVGRLQSVFNASTAFHLCQQYGSQLETLLDEFQPTVIADIQDQFGPEALQYVLDQPDRYFLLKRYGERLVELANVKGAIAFDLVQTYQPEFIELYYDDALFKTMSRFGVEGVLAVKAYKGMATTIFNLFADDQRLTQALSQYGYQQVIPVLHYFYQTQAAIPAFTERLKSLELAALFQTPETAAEGSIPSSAVPDDQTRLALQFDRASWGLAQIVTQGNTFLRQFEITAAGLVRPIPNLAAANLLEDLWLSSLRLPIATPSAAESASAPSLTCDQLLEALNLLSILPPETTFSRQARCLYLQEGIAAATSIEGIAGLIALEEYQELVTRYGTEVLPFVAQYGRDGIRLIEATNGAILQLDPVHDRERIQLALKYGAETLSLIETLGLPVIEVIRATDGAVLPYLQKYGQDVLKLLNQPDGQAFLELIPVFGDKAMQYLLQYPDDFPRYLLKYGQFSISALDHYNGSVVNTARKSGDDVIFFAGKYHDEVLRFINAGRIGLTLLRVLPEDLIEKNDRQILRDSLPRLIFALIVTAPRTMHVYIGELSQTLFALQPHYLQLIFWIVLWWVALLLLWSVLVALKRFFFGNPRKGY